MISGPRFPMSSLLLRLLLLAVFFNTTIGMPLHEATHLQRTGPDVVQAWSSLDAEEDVPVSGHGEQAHGLCAWCLAFGQQATALTSTAIPPQAATGRTAQRPPPPAVAFVPSPGRWRFASRDPPPLS